MKATGRSWVSGPYDDNNNYLYPKTIIRPLRSVAIVCLAFDLVKDTKFNDGIKMGNLYFIADVVIESLEIM